MFHPPPQYIPAIIANRTRHSRKRPPITFSPKTDQRRLPMSKTSKPSTCVVIFLGGPSVGKTSIINRFMYEQSMRDTEVTTGVDYYTKTIVVDDQSVSFQIWDTAGQEKHHSIVPMYFREAQVAILVYDLSDEKTLEAARVWHTELMEARADGVRVFLVGNKSDLDARVSESDVKKFTDEHRMRALKVSAVKGEGIAELFQTVAREFSAGRPIEAVNPVRAQPEEVKQTSRWWC
jgi:Ras-related protein Rab-5C